MGIKKVQSTTGEFKWEVRVYEAGRGSRRISRWFDKRTDAERFLQEWNIKVKQGALFENCRFDRKFQDEADHWFKDGEHRFAPGYLKRVKGILSEVIPKFGGLTLDKFTPELLTRYQREEKARGLENASVNKKTLVITAILNFSTKQRRIPFNPSSGFRKLNWIKPEMSFWNQQEASSFLEFTDTKYPFGTDKRWVYVVYLVALNTAIRAGEMWGLKPIDLNPDGKTILIRRQLNMVAYDFGPTKGKNQRAVPCNQMVSCEIQNLIRTRSIKDNESIFMNEERKPICHDNFIRWKFDKDIDGWGGRRIRFHDLRHTATTLLINSGVDIKTVKEICGHSNIATTMNYTHLLSGSVEKVSQSFMIAPRREEKT